MREAVGSRIRSDAGAGTGSMAPFMSDSGVEVAADDWEEETDEVDVTAGDWSGWPDVLMLFLSADLVFDAWTETIFFSVLNALFVSLLLIFY